MNPSSGLVRVRLPFVRFKRNCRFGFLLPAMMLVAVAPASWAQAAGSSAQNDAMVAAIHDLQQQVSELRQAVADMRSEAAQYRAETSELRRELQAERTQQASLPEAGGYAAASAADQTVQSPQVTTSAGSISDRVSTLEESTQLLNGKINEQYQTKVESASKYRVRLSGLVLLNLFATRGSTDNQDFPTWAAPVATGSPSGSFGATMRQSEIGLEVFGPNVAGARTSAEAQFDFAGGFPNITNGVTSGIFRMRTASMRMDWKDTSIIAGQDSLFISPESPTSFASLAVPEFSYAGNLWGWIPQVRVEHRFEVSERQRFSVQAGILDNLDGEQPAASSWNEPQAGEASGQPAYAVRTAWTYSVFGQPLTIGAAGYYGRQNWNFDRHVDGWAGMTDWSIPLLHELSLSGEFYRGFAIGGIGGGLGRSVVFSGDSSLPGSAVHGLNDVGGWSQLKLKTSARLEFNGGFGVDNPFGKDVNLYPLQGYAAPLYINRGAMANAIYRPRSNLLLSAEYRHLRTFFVDEPSAGANQVNLVMGVLF